MGSNVPGTLSVLLLPPLTSSFCPEPTETVGTVDKAPEFTTRAAGCDNTGRHLGLNVKYRYIEYRISSTKKLQGFDSLLGGKSAQQ